MLNRFTDPGCFQALDFGVLCANQEDVRPRNSQITAIVFKPAGSPGPKIWTSSNSYGFVKNTDRTTPNGRFIVGVGELTEISDKVLAVGKTSRVLLYKNYTLDFQVNTALEQNYEFIRTIQRQPADWRFWFFTLGFNMVGGPEGIRPSFVTANMPYGGGRSDYEKADVKIEYRAKIDPERFYLPGIFEALQFTGDYTWVIDDSGAVIIDDSGSTVGHITI
jgi:hypothetical protein